MKLIGWAIALAAAGMTPAAAQVPASAPPAATEAAQAEGNVSAAAANAADAAAEAPATTAALPPVGSVGRAIPEAGVGIPDGRRGLQQQVTEIGREAASFHDNWLLLMCAAISVFVLVLLVWTMFRYRRAANPTPSRNSHNTTIEVIWTLVPVLILVAIAIPSIRLLRHQYSPPPADLTVKVIGNQWYWTYQYPEHGELEIVSNMLKEQKDARGGERFRTDADGPPLLAVDERLVIPAGKVVKFIVTSNDVIHAFWIPAFWSKIDANPGRLNETWVKVDRPGVYFGQCTELCGARHAYMPIAVEVVPEAQFAQWITSKGGTMPGARPAATPDAINISPNTPSAVPPPAAAPQPAPAATTNTN
ncbi:cytochrome c oxidase subunit II [Sphingomonas lutea]|uniref:Cytochrome c oxidase subunit 2 n=1 Tax=Sphingomonas lutea TaxID=1045317 RepID=A0A7G9SJ31_9SPHN|nr:cytochrome c oxidase subunit II [Sphingomonas lutea]QNN67856.1 cytochrome c oxidase subunit II [Sphingomonas lutea]